MLTEEQEQSRDRSTLSASQCNSAIQPFARRLKAAGKAHKQVMTAGPYR